LHGRRESHPQEVNLMSKKDDHAEALRPLLERHARSGDREELHHYLSSNSNLPGPRGNLELAAAFADVAAKHAVTKPQLWKSYLDMASIGPAQAPVGAPDEFIPFCGTVAIGAVGAVVPARFDEAVQLLKGLANDPRWRMREAVCFGLQRMMVQRPRETQATLDGWIDEGSLLELRAAAAAAAEPALLKEGSAARWALDMHRAILARVMEEPERRSDPFRTLRQALGYTISVVVQALPDQGFPFLTELAAAPDPDVAWIVKQNLSKKRLTRPFADEVEAVRRVLTGRQR
jgi:hypothetical protein